MPSNGQQTTAASNKAQTRAALSAVPLSAWQDYEDRTGLTRAQFSKGFTLPTERQLRTIRAEQDGERASGVKPSQFMYEPADDFNSWKDPSLVWDFPVLKPEQKYEQGTGYPVSGTILPISHVGHFLNETPLSKSRPGSNDQLVFGISGDFAENTDKTSGGTQRDYARRDRPKRPQIIEARDPAILVRSGRASSTSSYESCRSGAS